MTPLFNWDNYYEEISEGKKNQNMKKFVFLSPYINNIDFYFLVVVDIGINPIQYSYAKIRNFENTSKRRVVWNFCRTKLGMK